MFCRIWGEDAVGYDCGDEVSDWFSEYLNLKGVRLIYSSQDLSKRKRTEQLNKKYRAVARDYDVVSF